MKDKDLDEVGSARPDSAVNGGGDLGALREILLREQEVRMNELAARLNDPSVRAEELSHVIPEAIARSSHRDTALSDVIMPNVEKAIESSVHKNSKVLADVIFPVMGPAMRKAISEALRERLQTLNRAIEQTFSWRGLKWRIEALRSGKSFGEVALLKSMLYRVEQVFLIHNETGLVLLHVLRSDAETQDSDMVASMLSAIRDFTRDSFQLGDEENLNTLEMGELTLWMEQGPNATVVAVIRGNAPLEIRTSFQAALEAVEREQADLMADFDGDPEPFEVSRRHLEPCLLYVESDTKQASKVPFYSLAFILLLLVAAAAIGVTRYENNRVWRAAFDEMDAAAGVVVTSVEKRGGRYYVSGLHDPMAIDPGTIVSQLGLDAAKLEAKWEPYQALAPSLQLERARRALEPPEGVHLSVHESVLTAAGSAPRQWIADARNIVRALPGIVNYDDSSLKDRDKDLTVFLDALADVQGILVTEAVKAGNLYVVSGFRDPLSEDPSDILLALNLEPDKFQQRWEPYQALGEGFVLERAILVLDPPDTVSLTLQDNDLVAAGEAPHAWIVAARLRAPSILGLDKIDFDGLIDTELALVRASAERMNEFRLFFRVNRTDLADEQDGAIEEIAAELNDLRRLATSAEIKYTVQIMGHSDSSGQGTANMELSRRRSHQVRALLAGAGIQDPNVYVLGVGEEVPLRAELTQDDLAFNRAVTFHVDLLDVE